jgi:S-adenosylmethionine decarboxylase
MNKIELHNFNNLTKTLSFNVYHVCYAKTKQQQQAFIKQIDKRFNANSLSQLLESVAHTIEANVLNIATQDYQPSGASASLLIAEHPEPVKIKNNNSSIVAHLDKSHITAHTYPEFHPDNGLCSFRADIDVSTCGLISPMSALPELFGHFSADVVVIDYRVRGFTRDIQGNKHYIDHDISSIQDFIPNDILLSYICQDKNLVDENMFHTKMKKQTVDLKRSVISNETDNQHNLEEVKSLLSNEISEIFKAKR